MLTFVNLWPAAQENKWLKPATVFSHGGFFGLFYPGRARFPVLLFIQQHVFYGAKKAIRIERCFQVFIFSGTADIGAVGNGNVHFPVQSRKRQPASIFLTNRWKIRNCQTEADRDFTMAETAEYD